MRRVNWRRAIALIAMVVGIGVGASTTPASAAVHSHQSSAVNSLDWWF
jgi:hypothetical protein